MWDHLSARTRLFMLASLALVSLALTSLIDLWSINQLTMKMESALARQSTAANALMAVESAHAKFKTQVQEWKNILLRGNDPAAFDKYLAQFGKAESSVQTILAQAATLYDQMGLARSDLDQLIVAHRQLGNEYRAALASYDKADPQAGQKVDRLVRGKDRAASQVMEKLVDAIEKYAKQQVAEEMRTATSWRNRILWLVGLSFALSALVICYFALNIVRSLLRQLGGAPAEAAAVCHRIAAGDLSSLIVATHPDSVIGSLSAMQERLITLVRNIKSEADQLTQSANNIAETSKKSAMSVALQRDQTGSMTAGIEEISVSIAQIRDNAANATAVARQSSEMSVTGKESIQIATAEMQRIADIFSSSAELVRTLGNQSENINTIVGTIREIADQTNLLALNAAIEAARAGESGRGFAVVADEVRKLAERTARSTNEIGDMIAGIQNNTRSAVTAMEDATHQVSAGMAKLRDSAGIVSNISVEGGKVLDAISEISFALDEQQAASGEVAQSLEDVAVKNEHNADDAERMAKEAKAMEQMAANLQCSIGQFKLPAAYH